jgi:phosphatidylserine decarboxylase
MLTKYGTDNIVFLILISVILLISPFFVNNKIFSTFLLLFGAFLLAFTLWFFRDPARLVNNDYINEKSVIVSPADGKIMSIEQVFEPNYMNDEAIRISIFLSPLDVHVNFIPLDGKIEYLNYKPGKFLAAYKDFASKDNEQSNIGLNHNGTKIFFTQIVGVLARRIVYDIKINDEVSRGQKFGMMKFGSRMDFFVPVGTEILCKPGDKVKAVEVPLCRLKH